MAYISRMHGISDASHYNWKSMYDGMEATDSKHVEKREAELPQYKCMYAVLARENDAMNALIDSARKLPRSKEVVEFLNKLQENMFDDVDYEQLGEPLREYLNDLQTELAAIHNKIATTWFPEV